MFEVGENLAQSSMGWRGQPSGCMFPGDLPQGTVTKTQHLGSYKSEEAGHLTLGSLREENRLKVQSCHLQAQERYWTEIRGDRKRTWGGCLWRDDLVCSVAPKQRCRNGKKQNSQKCNCLGLGGVLLCNVWEHKFQFITCNLHLNTQPAHNVQFTAAQQQTCVQHAFSLSDQHLQIE